MQTRQKRLRKELDTSEHEKSLESTLNDFEKKENPTTKDIMSAMLATMKHVIVINKLFSKHQENVEEIKVNLGHGTDKPATCEKKVNIMEQKEINTDLYLSNFPEKPDINSITANISKVLAIPREKIKSAYSFSLTRKTPPQSTPRNDNTQIFSVVLQLCDENTKISALRKKMENGVLKLEQLVPTSKAKFKNTSISCISRLTKFNNSVANNLIKAKSDKKIEKFQLRNGIFRFKTSASNIWTQIGTERDLKNFCSEVQGFAEAYNH